MRRFRPLVGETTSQPTAFPQENPKWIYFVGLGAFIPIHEYSGALKRSPCTESFSTPHLKPHAGVTNASGLALARSHR